MIRAISATVAIATTPDVDALVAPLNAHLSRPWTSWERSQGRTFSCGHMDRAEIETVTRLFEAEGWVVTYTSDQRDGSFLRFIPGTPEPSGHPQ